MPTTPRAAAATAIPDAMRCPLCGQGNGCAMEAARAAGSAAPMSCWCMDADFPAALLERVPPSARARACVCARCARHAAGAADPALVTH